jgi:hypothetical protein
MRATPGDQETAERADHGIHAMEGVPRVAENRRNDETHDQADPVDVFILPHDELVLAQVVDVVHRRLGIQLEHQPADVRPHEALGNVIGILVVIDVLVVAAVVGRPVEAGVFERAGAENQREQADRQFRLEGQVGKQTVVADGDAHHRGDEVEEEHAELEPIDSEFHQIDGQADQRDQGGADEKRAGDPVHSVKGNTIHGWKLLCLGRVRECGAIVRQSLSFPQH